MSIVSSFVATAELNENGFSVKENICYLQTEN